MALERDQGRCDLRLVVEQLGKVLQVEESASEANADVWVRDVGDKIRRLKGFPSESVEVHGSGGVIFRSLTHRHLACTQVECSLSCATLLAGITAEVRHSQMRILDTVWPFSIMLAAKTGSLS